MGAFGDGGAIVTNQEEIIEKVKVFRNYGSEKRYYNKVVGANSRLDELQAGFLRVRLLHMKEILECRQEAAQQYLKKISNSQIVLPTIREGAAHVWHQFVVRTKRRRELMDFLEQKGIGTTIHYPVPPHLSEAYQCLGMRSGSLPITEQYADEVLSLPLYDGITQEELCYVADAVNQFTYAE